MILVKKVSNLVILKLIELVILKLNLVMIKLLFTLFGDWSLKSGYQFNLAMNKFIANS